MPQYWKMRGGPNLVTGTITANNLAADSVDSSELVDGGIDDSHVGGLADTAATERVLPMMLYRLEFDSADFSAADDLTITFSTVHAVQIHDVWCIYTTAEGGALTLTLHTAVNAGGTALTATIDLNTTTDSLVRPATIDLSAATVAAGVSIYANASGNPGTIADARLNILYSHLT